MKHDEGDNYKCKVCKKYFASPMKASKIECEPKDD